jgi:hypothetical protein
MDLLEDVEKQINLSVDLDQPDLINDDEQFSVPYTSSLSSLVSSL